MLVGFTWFDQGRQNSKTTPYVIDERPVIGSMKKPSAGSFISAPSRVSVATAWGGAVAFAASLGSFLYAYLVHSARLGIAEEYEAYRRKTRWRMLPGVY